jgi:DNA-binding winged helix-turn-helix (wHTH) protein
VERIGFRDLVFDEGFATALRTDGEMLRFTRQERALLCQLAAHPRRLFSRAALYRALGSEGSDRNVDVVINSLRRKLRDTARAPRFISTQYGEGYVWIAEPASVAGQSGFLVVGPARGGRDARGMMAPLQAGLQARFGDHQTVAMAFTVGPKEAERFRFSLDVAVHVEGDRRHAALGLREQPGGEIIASLQETFVERSDALTDRLAAGVEHAVWKRLTLGPPVAPGPADPPMHLRMQQASILLDPPGAPWRANGQQLARLRAEHPDDPMFAVMWAMHLFGRMTLDPGREPLTRRKVNALIDEIEGVALNNLDFIRSDPVMALAGAKLLLGTHRGHVDLAEELANAALQGSAAFAAALPMLAQIKAYRGELADAQLMLEEALEFCDADTEFEVYIQVLRMQMLIAQENYADVAVVLERLNELQPNYKQRFGPLLLPPSDDGLARTLAPQADRLTLELAQRAIAYLHFLVAAYFTVPAHAANIMRGPLMHLVRRFGPGVASDEVWSEMPAELHYLRGPPAPKPPAPALTPSTERPR